MISEPVHRLHGSSLDSMVEAFTGSFGPVIIEPVGRSRDFRWSADFWTGDGVTLATGHHEAECFMRATTDTLQYVSVTVPRVGGLDVLFGSRTVEGRRGKLLFTNNVEPEGIILRGGRIELDALLIDKAIFAQAFATTFEMPLNGALDLSPLMALSTPTGRLIGCLAQAMIEGMRNDGPLLHSPAAMANLSSAFADMVVRLVPHRLSARLDTKVSLAAPRHVRDAIDFMCANIDRPITTPMVAKAVGISLRALENGFRAFRDTTPAAYLRLIRLRAAREDLLDPLNQQSVRDICLKWGFYHFGRFSIAYRSVYGESPSHTKRRSENRRSRVV